MIQDWKANQAQQMTRKIDEAGIDAYGPQLPYGPQIPTASTPTWGDRIQGAATDAKNNIVRTGKQAQQFTEEQLQKMKAFTTQNPEAAVGIALTSGVVVGGVGTAAAVS
jgi:hypothetical protein